MSAPFSEGCRFASWSPVTSSLPAWSAVVLVKEWPQVSYQIPDLQQHDPLLASPRAAPQTAGTTEEEEVFLGQL